jgi:hypothetical protein
MEPEESSTSFILGANRVGSRIIRNFGHCRISHLHGVLAYNVQLSRAYRELTRPILRTKCSNRQHTHRSRSELSDRQFQSLGEQLPFGKIRLISLRIGSPAAGRVADYCNYRK